MDPSSRYAMQRLIGLRDRFEIAFACDTDHVVNKKAKVVRVCLPPDANCLLSVMDHCLRSCHYVNVVIAGKHPAPASPRSQRCLL